MPPSHRHYADWTPERLTRWAGKIGTATRTVVETILTSRPHPQQGFRSCLGILHLTKKYGDERLEAACRRADRIGSPSYKSIASILKAGLDSQPLPGAGSPSAPLPAHDNLRGADYYR
jgi:transposase